MKTISIKEMEGFLMTMIVTIENISTLPSEKKISSSSAQYYRGKQINVECHRNQHQQITDSHL